MDEPLISKSNTSDELMLLQEADLSYEFMFGS